MEERDKSFNIRRRKNEKREEMENFKWKRYIREEEEKMKRETKRKGR